MDGLPHARIYRFTLVDSLHIHPEFGDDGKPMSASVIREPRNVKVPIPLRRFFGRVLASDYESSNNDSGQEVTFILEGSPTMVTVRECYVMGSIYHIGNRGKPYRNNSKLIVPINCFDEDMMERVRKRGGLLVGQRAYEELERKLSYGPRRKSNLKVNFKQRKFGSNSGSRRGIHDSRSLRRETH
jgi:hypothetical protein